jgi:predicted urease superfamily metal-dependent hydrolase
MRIGALTRAAEAWAEAAESAPRSGGAALFDGTAAQRRAFLAAAEAIPDQADETLREVGVEARALGRVEPAGAIGMFAAAADALREEEEAREALTRTLAALERAPRDEPARALGAALERLRARLS